MLLLPKFVSVVKKNPKVFIINAVVAALLLFLSLTFLIFPLKKEIAVLKQDKTSDESVLAEQQLILSKKNTLKTQVDRLNLAIPDDPQILKLGANLQTMAVRSGVFLKAVNFKNIVETDRSKESSVTGNAKDEFEESGEAESAGIIASESSAMTGKSLVTANFTVVLLGSKENFKKFIQAIETNLRLIDMVDSQISKETQDSGNNTYTLELNAYYLSGAN